MENSLQQESCELRFFDVRMISKIFALSSGRQKRSAVETRANQCKQADILSGLAVPDATAELEFH